MNPLYKLDYMSPIGVIEIAGKEDAVWSILFPHRDHVEFEGDAPSVLEECKKQLDDYFKGTRFVFTFPIHIEGTPFQKNVLETLNGVLFGETATYKELAGMIGNDRAIRAVGRANGLNKLSIMIPCHRIIGSNGSLTGYAGGIWRKEWLLRHEKTYQPKDSRNFY